MVGYDAYPDIDFSGIELIISPVISADKRFVSLNLEFTQYITREFRNFIVSTGALPADSELPTTGSPTVTVQLPEKDENTITTHVSIPDGGTLLLGGQKIVGEVERESGVPTLSKLPLINRLFSNRSIVKDEAVLLILIKPKIILQDEEESLRFESLARD